MISSQIVKNTEIAINQIAKEFQKDGAFYFRTENDIQCRLFNYLEKNLGDVEIIHSEERFDGTSRHYDLAIWNPRRKKKAKDNWCKTNTQLLEVIPNLNLIAIEIIRFYGGVSSANELIKNKLTNDDDIKKLILGIGEHCKYGYYLMFWDEDIQDKENCKKCFALLQNKFGEMSERYDSVRYLCISRDGTGFYHGFTRGTLLNGLKRI